MKSPLRVRIRLWFDPGLARGIKEMVDNPEIHSGASVLGCPKCGAVLHWTNPGDTRPTEAIAQEAEERCRLHLQAHHPWMWWAYGKFGWKWLIKGFA